MTLPVENFPETDLIVVRSLGLHDYEPLWRDMQQFAETRSALTPDEIWFTRTSAGVHPRTKRKS